MVILKPYIYRKYPEIVYGFNTKWGNGRQAPYFFNVSYSVGDDEAVVNYNRRVFFESLGLDEEHVAFQKQVHSDNINIVNKAGSAGNSDALITTQVNLGLAISTADCNPVFIYDPQNRVIAGIHSGWRSTQKRIVEKTLNVLKNQFNSSPGNMIVYMGPSISFNNYEVGEEVAELFDKKYTIPANGKFLLDVAGANYDMLLGFGVKKDNIQKSVLCSFQMQNLLHSYRRDGLKSGRSLGIIAMKEK
jgi:YfiH family protein